ncbi:MAG: RraA family protein, partial [Planctomycetota bacterium]|nr:RraA family protein [Planctomycetota bacterium]
VMRAEVIMLRDRFGHQRLREGKYTAGQIDSSWTADIEKDFTGWLEKHKDRLPVPRKAVEELLEKRTR